MWLGSSNEVRCSISTCIKFSSTDEIGEYRGTGLSLSWWDMPDLLEAPCVRWSVQAAFLAKWFVMEFRLATRWLKCLTTDVRCRLSLLWQSTRPPIMFLALSWKGRWTVWSRTNSQRFKNRKCVTSQSELLDLKCRQAKVWQWCCSSRLLQDLIFRRRHSRSSDQGEFSCASMFWRYKRESEFWPELWRNTTHSVTKIGYLHVAILVIEIPPNLSDRILISSDRILVSLQTSHTDLLKSLLRCLLSITPDCSQS